MFVPLRHDPGHAQADFGEALAVIGGVERKVHFVAMDLPHSDAAGFVQAYPAETTEAFCAGHVAAFAFFGGVPASILYDNTSSWRWPAFWATAHGNGRACSANCNRITYSPIGLADPARATTKARWRVWSGWSGGTTWCRFRMRRSFAALNEQLLADCHAARLGDRLRGHDATIGARLARDERGGQASIDLPVSPYDACEKSGRAGSTSLSLACYRSTDYSVPTRLRPSRGSRSAATSTTW